MQRKINITSNIGLDDGLIKTMLDKAQVLYDAVALTKVEFTQSPGDPAVFDYKITAVDGRVWAQEITFSQWPAMDVDPPMTFDVPDGWKRQAEFQYHRDLRTHLIAMVNNAGMTHLEITWA